MDKMDTDINNYSVEEILNLLKINEYNCELDSIFCIIIELLDEINDSYNIDDISNKKSILLFFRQSFYKICNFYNLLPSENMKKNIDSKLIINELNYPINESKNKEADQFIGALPIKVPEATTVSSNIDKYARGLVNPLQRETINNILTINSKFRDYATKIVYDKNSSTKENSINKSKDYTTKFVYDKNSSTTDFSIILTEPFNNVVSLKLASIELTNSYYSISDYLKTNIFTINTYNLNTTTNAITNLYTREITINEGKYTSTTLVNTLNAIFIADASLAMIEVSYNILKEKLIFAINPTYAFPPPLGTIYAFDLNFTISADKTRPIFLNLGWLLGFKKDEYTFLDDYVKTETPTKVVGFNPESTVDLLGTKIFLLEVTDFNNNAPAVLKYNTNDRHWFNIKDILAQIPNKKSTYSVISEDSSDRIFKNRKYFGPVKIQKLRIRLLDENGKVVDLNDSEMIISFNIEMLDMPYKNKA
jgi:hypothetical protein